MPNVNNSKCYKRPRASFLSPSDSASPSMRDTSTLFAAVETVKCAFDNRCIPCSYKIGTFDVALDSEFCQRIPNQRPELCPRAHLSRLPTRIPSDPAPLGYKKGMSVLTVGDGDFSFSLALARFGCVVVATSYEPKDTVINVYNSLNVAGNIAELDKLGATICFGVNGTILERTLPKSLAQRKYQRIIWNFPCSAVAKGQDGQNREMEFNKKLVNDFIKSSWPLLCPHGRIFITHKTKPPFNQWKIDEVAVSDVSNVRYLHRVVFDRCLFPPYVPRKALDSKSFPCHDACTYIFEILDSRAHSTSSTSEEINSIPSVELSDTTFLKDVAPSSMVLVTPTLLHVLRCNLLRSTPDKPSLNQAKRKRS